MYKSPRKEREDKYQRLLRMIKNYQHTRQDLKLLNKIKDTGDAKLTGNMHFLLIKNKQILRMMKLNNLNQEMMERDLVYDLNSQNKEYIAMRLRIPTIGKVSPREKVMTEPSEKEKARSLSRKIKRVLIGRLEDEAIMTKQKFLETYRLPTQSTISSQKNSARKLNTPKHKPGSRTCRNSSQKIKTQQSPQKKKPIMFHQFQTMTLKKIATRLRTQKSNEKKSRIQTLVSDELKRQAKQDHLIKCASSALKIKSKTILQKNYY